MVLPSLPLDWAWQRFADLGVDGVYDMLALRAKVFILRRAEELSISAANALLKTLEEPPERAKFFFATTEAHKVLPTILSRCQRFDLGPADEDFLLMELRRFHPPAPK